MGVEGWDREVYVGVEQRWVWRDGALIGVEELRRDSCVGVVE